ncbi:hypothetical protein [Clostridium butyricum]
MIQIVKKKAKNTENIVDIVNYVSINFEYFKDYQLINKGEEYDILLKFDVPNVLDSLQLVNLKEEEVRGDIFNYHICNYGDGNTFDFGFISVNKIVNGIQIRFLWNIKSFMDPITIIYEKEFEEFKVYLNDFNMNHGYGENNYIEKNMLLKEIDYKMITEHLIAVTKKIGYLFDRQSIINLERSIVALSVRLNKKEF